MKIRRVLIRIVLSNNKLKVISEGLFFSLKTLKTLELNNNSIEIIKSNSISLDKKASAKEDVK